MMKHKTSNLLHSLLTNTYSDVDKIKSNNLLLMISFLCPSSIFNGLTHYPINSEFILHYKIKK